MKSLEIKEQKKKNNRLLAAVILLLILVVIGIYSKDNFNLKQLINLFKKEVRLTTPLAQNDPIPELTNLLILKNISIEFPLIATESAIIAHLKDDGEIWFSPNKDFSLQVSTLETILSGVKAEDKKIKRIDLRFERPSVVY